MSKFLRWRVLIYISLIIVLRFVCYIHIFATILSVLFQASYIIVSNLLGNFDPSCLFNLEYQISQGRDSRMRIIYPEDYWLWWRLKKVRVLILSLVLYSLSFIHYIFNPFSGVLLIVSNPLGNFDPSCLFNLGY